MRCTVVLLFCAFASAAIAIPPVISGVGASPVNDTWVRINWQTDAPADSVVDYGPTASYGSTVTNAALVTTHNIQLDNLTSGTLYHYRVKSTNGSGETTTSGDFSFTTQPAEYGCEGNPTGEPIGGGFGYSRIITPGEANVVVSTPAQLLSAISSATSGTIIYVDDNAQIDLTAQTSAIMVPGGVTIASGRGRNGSVGGLLFTNLFSARRYLFQSNGAGVRFTGLRIAGPYNGTGRTIPYSYGVTFAHDNCEIDNCEIIGFNLASIASSGTVKGMRVHHNYIHHNQRSGWGYGVACYTSQECLIEGNLFDYTRHAVASSGQRPASYEARYNLYMDSAVGHIFDMHGANDFEKTIMQGNWRFDESAGTTANETAVYGVGDATIYNFNTPACWVDGKINHALQFDGVDDYVDCGANAALAGGNFSLTAWIKPASVTGTQAIASRGDTASPGYGYSLRLVGSTLQGIVHNSTGTIASAASNSGTIPPGVWTHVAMTFNGATATLYINGASARTFSCSGVRQSSALHFIIGRDAAGETSHFNGALDEVRCYNSCITANDVLRHYNLQGDVAGDTIRIHHNTVRCIDDSPVVIRGIPAIGCWVNNNWFWRAYSNLVVRQINATGNMFVSDNLYGLITPAPDPAEGTMLAEWRFNEGAGSTAADSSGNARTGTLTNMTAPACWVPGKSGMALSFDGVNDYVSCGSSLTQTDNIAIDLWVKFNKFAEHQYVFTNGFFDIYNRGGWAGNKLYFLCKINQSVLGGDSAWAGKTGVKCATELTTGTWYRISCTRAGNKMRIFINNQLERELNCLEGYTIGSPALLKIGQNPFQGVIDEVKVFTPGPEFSGNHAPTLTWTGETNFSADGLNPQSGTMSDAYTFRVKYGDADGDPPLLGYPKLRILRGGVEFAYGTPLTMMPIDGAAVSTGRIYTCTLKLPRGSDYSYYFEAKDELGIPATGAATAATSGPNITTGNTAPILMWPDETNFVEAGAYPLSGDTDTTIVYRAAYMDVDNDPPRAGYPKVRIMHGSTDIPGSPFTMTATDSGSFLTGRKYQFAKKLSAATDYTYQFIAYEANGAAADPSVSVNAPDITAGATVWTEVYTTAPDPITTAALQVNVVFSQSVTGFVQGDVAVTNGVISAFSGSEASYSFTVTPTASGVVTVNVPAGVCANGSALSNLASNTISRVYYPAAGANDIWVGHGYPGARVGTYADPFDVMADGTRWLKSGGTLHVFGGANPEAIRITKPMRIQSQNGTATIGAN